MRESTDWFAVGREVLDGRARQVWKGVYPSAEAWMEALSGKKGRSVATLRRWASGRKFVDAVAGQAGFPDLGVLGQLPFSFVEQLVTLHRLDPKRAAASAREASAGGATMRKLRDDAHRLAGPRRSSEEAQRAEGCRRLLAGLGEPTDLVAVPWPRELAFPKPDLLLADSSRIVAVGLIGARLDAASSAKVSWAVGVSGLVDAVWLIGPVGGAFPREVQSTLSRLGGLASRIGVAVMDDAEGGSVAVLRRPTEGQPEPDYRSLLRDALGASESVDRGNAGPGGSPTQRGKRRSRA